MRRVLMTGLLAILTSVASTGCFINEYAADPLRRYQQLFYQSEDLRAMEDEAERFWMLDRPSNLTLKRYHGLADPAARRHF